MPLATDSLSLVFIACFLFGLLFLVVSALLGSFHGIGGHGSHHIGIGGGHGVDAHDAGHIHIGHSGQSVVHQGTHHHGSHAGGNPFSLFAIFNPTSIVLFLVGFGFFGYVFKNTTILAFPLILLLATICGVVVAALMLALLARIFGNSEGATIQDISDRTGLLGKVSITIQEHSLGEILYVSPGGMRKSIPARSVDGRRLERDQEVVVVNYQNGIAEVDTWEHFVNQDEPESLGSGNAEDELATLRALIEDNTITTTQENTSYAARNDAQKE